MIKRIVEISTDGCGVNLRDNQLRVEKSGELLGTVPCEDIGALVLNPSVTISGHALAEINKQGGVVVVCGSNRMPEGILFPTEGNAVHAERLRFQVEASQPQRKRAWQQVVRCKIRRQARLLESGSYEQERLQALSEQVRSGDPENLEAQAARIYWQKIFPLPEFRRRRDGDPPNGLLNYGYAILRACMARSLCAAGLHPAFGINHSNKYNAFALADDLMEAYRPDVDACVRNLVAAGTMEVDKSTKPSLLGVLLETVVIGGEESPLQVAMQKSANSLLAVFMGETEDVAMPE
ncbi:MAG: CRISPR-associated endonuclease Cas1 [Myxococcota bacterium]|nr:CRISPR-associated endonuclease Cas1 [Myxococcota bacterium]